MSPLSLRGLGKGKAAFKPGEKLGTAKLSQCISLDSLGSGLNPAAGRGAAQRVAVSPSAVPRATEVRAGLIRAQEKVEGPTVWKTDFLHQFKAGFSRFWGQFSPWHRIPAFMN